MKKIRNEQDWQEIKLYLKHDGYSNVVEYVQDLKKNLADLKEQLEYLKFIIKGKGDSKWLLNQRKKEQKRVSKKL